MGCGASAKVADDSDVKENEEKEFEDEMADPQNEEINIDDIVLGYPPPLPPRNKKAEIFRMEDFSTIDQRAREAPIGLTSSWDDLIAYLSDGCTSDLEKLRSVFVWLGTVNINAIPHTTPVPDPESLQTMLRGIKMKRMSYAVFFAYLCRAAKLPCVLIRGYGKSVAYEVGDDVDRVRQLHNIWNAVYVDGDWRLVVPLWACRAVVGHSTGKYTLVESKGTAVRSVEGPSAGQEVVQLNEHYFLTDPEELVVVLLALDPKWQLLNKPYTIEKFCAIPFIRQTYFENSLQIKGEFKGCNSSRNGVCDIAMEANRESWDGALTYELYFNNEESEENIPDDLQLDRYVIMGRQMNKWTFIVRFPIGGVYKMSIFGGRSAGNSQWICDFKLVCNKPKNNVRPLPCDPGIMGFGPTQNLQNYGLSSPSHSNGIIIINKKQQVNLSFNMKKKVVFRTELVHNDINRELLKKYIKQVIENKKLQLKVSVPYQAGEFAVRMYAKNKETNTEDNVCNYLLTTDNPQGKATRENPTEKRARENLKAILDSTDPVEIEEAIEKCNELHLDDKGDLSKATKRITYLELKQELHEATNRRYIDALEKAITHAKESEFVDDLKPDIVKARHVLEQLRRLHGFLHEILEMKQATIAEIRCYTIPQPITLHIMTATFILLGEKEEDLQDWERVRKLLHGTGKHRLITKIKNFDFVRLTSENVASAQELIEHYDKDTAQKASAGVGTFFVWCENVCNEFQRSHPQIQAPQSAYN